MTNRPPRQRLFMNHKPNIIPTLAARLLALERIRELSPILRDMENAGKIQIAGSIYDVNTGRVRFLPPDRR
jgi:hypothetical protein